MVTRLGMTQASVYKFPKDSWEKPSDPHLAAGSPSAQLSYVTGSPVDHLKVFSLPVYCGKKYTEIKR